jgi:hypothetical protein
MHNITKYTLKVIIHQFSNLSTQNLVVIGFILNQLFLIKTYYFNFFLTSFKKTQKNIIIIMKKLI